MNTENTAQQTPDPVPATETILRERPGALPKFPKRHKSLAAMIAGGALVLVGGFGLGLAAAPDKAPESCLLAIESGETIIGIQGEGLMTAADAIDSASRFSISGIDRNIDKLDGLAGELRVETPTYKMHVDRCMETK